MWGWFFPGTPEFHEAVTKKYSPRNTADTIPAPISETALAKLYDRAEWLGLHIPFRLLMQEVAENADAVLSDTPKRRKGRQSKQEKEKQSIENLWRKYVSDFQYFPEGFLSNTIGVQSSQDRNIAREKSLQEFLDTLELYDINWLTPPSYTILNIATSYSEIWRHRDALGYIEDIHIDDVLPWIKEHVLIVKNDLQYRNGMYMEVVEGGNILLGLGNLPVDEKIRLHVRIFGSYYWLGNYVLASKYFDILNTAINDAKKTLGLQLLLEWLASYIQTKRTAEARSLLVKIWTIIWERIDNKIPLGIDGWWLQYFCEQAIDMDKHEEVLVAMNIIGEDTPISIHERWHIYSQLWKKFYKDGNYLRSIEMFLQALEYLKRETIEIAETPYLDKDTVQDIGATNEDAIKAHQFMLRRSYDRLQGTINDIYLNLGCSYFQEKNYNQAIFYAQKYIDGCDSDVDKKTGYVLLAKIYAHMSWKVANIVAT